MFSELLQAIPSESAVLMLIEKFDKLINKYAYKLQ